MAVTVIESPGLMTLILVFGMVYATKLPLGKAGTLTAYDAVPLVVLIM